MKVELLVVYLVGLTVSMKAVPTDFAKVLRSAEKKDVKMVFESVVMLVVSKVVMAVAKVVHWAVLSD